MLILVSSVISAQQAPPKRWKLVKVEAPNLSRFSPQQILELSELKLGDTVDLDLVDAAMARLTNTGFFTKGSYHYKYVGDQLTVTFALEEATWSIPVVFDNFIWFSDEELAAKIRQAVPAFDGTVPKSGEIAGTITATLEKLVHDKGVSGRVEYLPAYAPGGQQLAHVFAVRDQPMPICRVNFGGAAAVSESDLIKRSKPLINADYSRSFVGDFVKDNLVPVYRERGYLKVRFDNSQAQREEGGCKGVHVSVSVAEGAVYSWDKVDWSGNVSIGTPDLEAMLSMRNGDLANGVKFDDGLKQIKTAYGKRGYISSRLDPKPTFDDDNRRVAYRVSISEGPQYHMGSLSFAGIPESEATRLRKSWGLREGAVYNASYLDDYMRVWLAPTEEPGRKLKGISLKPDLQRLTVDVSFTFK